MAYNRIDRAAAEALEAAVGAENFQIGDQIGADMSHDERSLYGTAAPEAAYVVTAPRTGRPYDRARISRIICRRISVFFPIRSSRVSPGFWLAPAVITMRAQSPMSS